MKRKKINYDDIFGKNKTHGVYKSKPYNSVKIVKQYNGLKPGTIVQVLSTSRYDAYNFAEHRKYVQAVDPSGKNINIPTTHFDIFDLIS